jgi:hypothetical protein
MCSEQWQMLCTPLVQGVEAFLQGIYKDFYIMMGPPHACLLFRCFFVITTILVTVRNSRSTYLLVVASSSACIPQMSVE